jgi:hypothetical protein
MLQRYSATRYLVPLREGGSLPAVLDTDGGGLFVAKFRGAGQGARALLAELIVGLIAREAGLPVPELALIELDDSFARTERDPEIQDILRASQGTNVGLRYLEGAFNFDPLAIADVDPDLASRIVWLDAFASNIDRTARNPNMMVSSEELWLIDHGAALFFHHNWPSVDEATARSPFSAISGHLLLDHAEKLAEADRYMSERITPELITRVVDAVPDELYMDAPTGTEPPFATAAENREAYRVYLERRIAAREAFVDEARRARERRLADKPQQQGYRK